MEISNVLKVSSGRPTPLGPFSLGDCVNFSLYAPHAQSVRITLWEENKKSGLLRPEAEIILDPEQNRTGDTWHVEIDGLPKNVFYHYQTDKRSAILDPYCPEIWSGGAWRDINAIADGQPCHYFPLNFLRRTLKREPNRPGPKIPLKDLIIYEMHVRGLTQHPSSKAQHPGTYLGVIEKLPDIKRMGFNAIELLPIQEFYELSRFESLIKTRSELINYWGYSPVSFFAPMNRYASCNKPGAAADELRQLVNACHELKIEVIVDFVVNHTDARHPCRTLDRDSYYIVDHKGRDTNDTGCGNTFSCNHPLSMDLILASLRHWVTEFGIDGFRFDLASIMTRGEDGSPLAHPPLIHAMNTDPILKEVKFIAEAWDAGGLYHVGNFPSHEGRWAEWNGRYRDTIRKFIKGSPHQKAEFATAVSGYESLYHHRKPFHSINMVTCHDGFSLQDLVSFQDKHNETNGENNRDGTNAHDSWNCGVEGPTEDPGILELRERQMKNLITALLISQGVPLIRMGDERRHSQNGNNNTWCQDNELSWIDWSKPINEFIRDMILFRKGCRLLHQGRFLTDADVDWHMDNWEEDTRFVAFTLNDHDEEQHLFIAFNASHEKKELILPKPPPQSRWRCVLGSSHYRGALQPYSSVIFQAEKIHA